MQFVVLLNRCIQIMEEKERFSLTKRIKSFTYAFRGIIFSIKNEHNIRIHFFLLTFAIIIAVVFKINYLEWCLLFIVMAMVLAAELFNSAIEKLADIVNPDWNKKVMLLKDYSAGAVLVSAIVSIVVGCLIFIPKIIHVLEF